MLRLLFGAPKILAELGLNRAITPAATNKISGDQRFHSGKAHDVIIVGNGAFGSSIAYHLSKQGAKVLTLDMHPPAHPWGSSHGHTRIIRLAYFEGPEYVPLLRRSYDLFLELQDLCGQELFFKTGVLDVGTTFEKAYSTARRYNLPHEVLTAKEVNTRFPGYSVPEDVMSLFQPDGGILCPENIIQAHSSLAMKHGCTVRSGVTVASWRGLSGSAINSTGSVEIKLSNGEKHVGAQLVLTAGAWMSQLVPELKRLCVPERQVVAWFDCPEDQFAKESFPVFIAGSSDNEIFYGFPQYGQQRGFKIGLYNHLREIVDPDNLDRTFTRKDEVALRRGVQQFFKSADNKVLHSNTCMFTNTPDGHFILDRHPAYPQVILCSACSGHGFKMSSGVGQLLSDIALSGGPGSSDVQQELQLHRINSDREGHAEFIQASLSSS